MIRFFVLINSLKKRLAICIVLTAILDKKNKDFYAIYESTRKLKTIPEKSIN